MDKKSDLTRATDSDLGLLHLKLVTKLALLTAVAAIVLLLVMAGVLSTDTGDDYFQIIQAHSLTRQHLAPAMVVVTLLLLAVVGLSVGFITLYSSFRLAGPLFRFSRIFQQAGHPVPTQHLRRKDSLQEVSREIQEGIEHLHAHYRSIQAEVEALQKILRSAHGKSAQYQHAIARLKKLQSEIQFDA